MLTQKQIGRTAALATVLAVVLAMMLILTACPYVRQTGSGPARKPTPLERALAANAILANANLAVAQGVIAANEAGEIGVPLANTILTEQSKIADADRQLTMILQKGAAAASGDAARIQELLAQIEASADRLISSGTAGIKNPERAALISTNAQAILAQARQIVTLLQAAEVIK